MIFQLLSCLAYDLWLMCRVGVRAIGLWRVTVAWPRKLEQRVATYDVYGEWCPCMMYTCVGQTCGDQWAACVAWWSCLVIPVCPSHSISAYQFAFPSVSLFIYPFIYIRMANKKISVVMYIFGLCYIAVCRITWWVHCLFDVMNSLQYEWALFSLRVSWANLAYFNIT